jgi:RecQ-mediated genome instability protein 1
MSALSTQLSTALQAHYSLAPSPAYLTTFLSSTRQPPPPLPALTSTLHFRILASDITTSLLSSPTTTFPAGIASTSTKEIRLQHAVACQVLDVRDLGSSKWSQVEAIERVERGEEVRGREVIRTVPGLNDDGEHDVSTTGTATATATNGHANGVRALPTPAATASSTTAANTAPLAKRSQGPHQLLLADAAGTQILAFEHSHPFPRLFITNDPSNNNEGISIGAKIVLQPNTLVRRGMVMLDPQTVKILGGKIDSWDRAWRKARKESLIAEVTGVPAD